MNYTYILPILTLLTMSSVSAATPVEVGEGKGDGTPLLSSTSSFPVPTGGIAVRASRAGSTASTPRSVGGASSFTVTSSGSVESLPVLPDDPSFDDMVEYATALLKQYQTLKSKRSTTNQQVREYLQSQISKLEAVSGAVVREPGVKQSLRVVLETSISKIVHMYQELEERSTVLARENAELAEVRDRALSRTNALTGQVGDLTGDVERLTAELDAARRAATEARRPASPDIERGRVSYHTIDGRDDGYTQLDDDGAGAATGDAGTALLGKGKKKETKKEDGCCCAVM